MKLECDREEGEASTNRASERQAVEGGGGVILIVINAGKEKDIEVNGEKGASTIRHRDT
jgi:hypothetical protein